MKTKIFKGLIVAFMAFNFLLAATDASAYYYRYGHRYYNNGPVYHTGYRCWWVPAHRDRYGYLVRGHRVCN